MGLLGSIRQSDVAERVRQVEVNKTVGKRGAENFNNPSRNYMYVHVARLTLSDQGLLSISRIL